MKKTGVVISCGIAAILFLIFLVKGNLLNALFILLLIFGAITGQLMCALQDNILKISSFVIVLFCSFAFGIYSLIGGETVIGALSAVPVIFSALGLRVKKSKID